MNMTSGVLLEVFGEIGGAPMVTLVPEEALVRVTKYAGLKIPLGAKAGL